MFTRDANRYFGLECGSASYRFGRAAARDIAEIYLPETRLTPSPVLVALHGAGSTSERVLSVMRPHADRTGVILIAPQSHARTWDMIAGDAGPDVESIDAALAFVFAKHEVDRARIAICGFSDGASYALTLGLANGDLVTHVIALSPGFLVSRGRSGAPRVFVSHGADDSVLPVDRCGRRIAWRLQDAGIDVVYREHAGGHTVPPGIASEAFDWFTDRSTDREPEPR